MTRALLDHDCFLVPCDGGLGYGRTRAAEDDRGFQLLDAGFLREGRSMSLLPSSWCFYRERIRARETVNNGESEQAAA